MFWWMSAACVAFAVIATRDRPTGLAIAGTLMGFGLMLMGRRLAEPPAQQAWRRAAPGTTIPRPAAGPGVIQQTVLENERTAERWLVPFWIIVLGAVVSFYAPRLLPLSVIPGARVIPWIAVTLADWLIVTVGATVLAVVLLETNYARRWIPPLVWTGVCWAYLGMYAAVA
jgi:hypothetical protein